MFFDSITLIPAILSDVHVLDCLTYPSSAYGTEGGPILQDSYLGTVNQSWHFVAY